jgi:hypothetical protein
MQDKYGLEIVDSDSLKQVKDKLESAVDNALTAYDEKLAEFFMEHWPEKFGRDPCTFVPKAEARVLVSAYTRAERYKLFCKLEAAKRLLEGNGYTVSQSEHE